VLRRHRYLDGRLLVPELDRPLRRLTIDEREQILADVGEEIVCYFEQRWRSGGLDRGPTSPTVDPSPAFEAQAARLASTGDGRTVPLIGVPELPDDYVERDGALDEVWATLEAHSTAAIGGVCTARAGSENRCSPPPSAAIPDPPTPFLAACSG
jgi:hypothetical protein